MNWGVINVSKYIAWKRFEKTKNSNKVKNFAGINFRGWKVVKNLTELTFAEKAKKRETAKVSGRESFWP